MCPDLLKELLIRFDINRPHTLKILGFKKVGACLVKSNEAVPGIR
jgi:hypothetical protein